MADGYDFSILDKFAAEDAAAKRAPVAPVAAPLPASAPEKSQYDFSILDKFAAEDPLAQERAKAQANALEASFYTPEVSAKVAKLARDAGLPPAAVEGNEAETLRTVMLRQNEDILAKNPLLASVVAGNPEFMKMASGSLATADAISKALEAGGFAKASVLQRAEEDRTFGTPGRVSAVPPDTSLAAKLEFLARSAKSGTYSAESMTLRLLDAILPTTSEEELAALYKNDPEGLKRMQNAPTNWLKNLALVAAKRADAEMKKVSPGAAADLNDRTYSELPWSGSSAWASPTKITGDFLQSLPSMAALMVAMRFAGAKAAEAEATALAGGVDAAVARVAGIKAASDVMVLGGAAEGLQTYLQNSPQVQADLGDKPQEYWNKSPMYLKLRKEGYDDYPARVAVAVHTAEAGAAAGGFSTGTMSAAGGPILGKIIGEGNTLWGRLWKGFTAEAAMEGPQSAGEQFFQNYAEQKFADPTKSLSDGVLEAGLQGVAVGGFGGGVFSMAHGRAADGIKTEADAAVLRHIMQQAAAWDLRSLDDHTFAQFFKDIAPDATVFIDPITVRELMQQGKIDDAKLPSVLAQEADATNVGPGIEVPVSELVTAFAGTSVEQEVVRHTRMSPNAQTLAEVQAPAQAASEFLHAELGRVMEEQSKNAEFVKSAKEVHDDIVTRLSTAHPFGERYTVAVAKLLDAFYATQAQVYGVLPKQIRDGWTNDKGQTFKGYKPGWLGPESAPTSGQELNQPKRTILNIGLSTAEVAGGGAITEADVVAAVQAAGGVVKSVNTHRSTTEDTAVLVIENPLPKDVLDALSVQMRQQAIVQSDSGDTGELYGPMATTWGPYDRKEFMMPEGNRASEVFNQATQSEAQQWRDKITKGYDAAVAEYNALDIPELRLTTNGGQVLNTDLARELFPAYRENRARSADVHEYASAFVKHLYRDLLAKPTPEGKLPVVLFTAGGTGAGKSTGLLHVPSSADVEIIYDTNMNKSESATTKIEQALQAGRGVIVQYTYRHPMDALVAGALPRAERMGRTIPLREHLNTHVGSLETIEALAKKYAGDDRVQFFYVDNSRGQGLSAPLTSLPNVADNTTYEDLHEALVAERQAGRISHETFQGFAGTPAGSRPEEAGRYAATANLGQHQRRSAEVAGPVVGVHFSHQPRAALSSSAFGKGMPGAERARLANATDPRIKQRVAFYVDTGNGIHPESGVGGQAHTATLTNLYDADADALKIWKNAGNDMNAAESAVLDAGYDGYLSRAATGKQGAAVLLGSRSVRATHVGGLAEATAAAKRPPAANIPAAKTAAMALAQDKTLPTGRLTPAEWAPLLAKAGHVIDLSKLDQGRGYYKSDLAGELWQGSDNWYYSQLARAIEQAPAKVFSTGGAVASWLTSNAAKLGVKKDEIQWSGITDWLEAQGENKVSKEDVVAFLKAGGVRVETAELGDDVDPINRVGVEKNEAGKWRVFYVDTGKEYGTYSDAVDARAARERAAEALTQKTKFSQYVPPGGIEGTYRETLVTLPLDTRAYDAAREALKNADSDYTLAQLNGGEGQELFRLKDAIAAAKTKLAASTPKTFNSAHWDVGGVLVHLRHDMVLGEDGKQYVRVIEVQSDWGQKGKKEGFFETYKASDISRLPEGSTEIQSPNFWYFKVPGNVLQIPKKLYPTEAEAVRHILTKPTSGATAPVAPFVTDTKSWVALGIKKMIRYAAEQNAAGIVFATGQQNADLYDLSKHVGMIGYVKRGENFNVTAWAPDSVGGNTVWRRESATLQEVEDTLGKEVAEKMARGVGDKKGGEAVYLSGLDLKVGGEGMRTFYDQIVPQVANDVLKKLGAGVKVGDVDLPNGAVVRVRADKVVVTLADGSRSTFSSEAAAQEYWKKFGGGGGRVPGFPLTDALRESALAGMPLFQPKAEGPKLGSFNPNTLDIRFLAEANFSTAVHELSHFFLHSMLDMAQQEGAPARVVEDANAILKHIGFPGDLAAWHAASLDQQRPFHEAFAESGEQYFFTGKAPSHQLQGVFNNFVSWMKRVYLSLKEFVRGHPDAKLNPELSDIFDRILATDAEIDAMAAQRSYTALFKDAAVANMTPAQFAEYTAITADEKADAQAMLAARSLRDLRWTQNRHNKLIAEMQAANKELRTDMLLKVQAEMAAQPVRVAMRWLKTGEITNSDGQEIKVTEGFKLSRSDVEAMFPPGALEQNPAWKSALRGMLTDENGLSPDIVAEMTGFQSGEQMVREIVAAPKFKDAVEAETNNRMLDEYGDLNSPDAMSRAADAALHNDSRARSVATELWALNKNIGSVAQIMRAAREYAAALIEQRTPKTIKPWAFAAAETRAHKAAAAALKKDDLTEAAKQQRTVVLNNAATKQAYAAEAEIKAIVARWKKIAAYSDKHSSVKSRDFATVQAVRAVIAEMGIGTKGEKALTYLDRVKEYDPQTAAMLASLVQDMGGEVKAWEETKLADLRKTAEDINDLWRRARELHGIEVDGHMVEVGEIEEAIVGSLAKQKQRPVIGKEHAVTKTEKAGLAYSALKSVLARLEIWADKMDGGNTLGPIKKYLVQTVVTGQDNYMTQREVVFKQLEELLARNKALFTPREIVAPEIGYTFGKGPSKSGMAELLMAILHTGNASNEQKLLLGRDWGTVRKDDSLDTSKWDALTTRLQDAGVLTKEVYDVAQQIWDIFETLKPAAQKAHRRVFGRFFNEITHREFTNRFGTYKGGYIPAVTDKDLVQDKELRDLETEAMDGVVKAFPAPASGFAKERVESYHRELALEMTQILGHLNTVLLFSHMAVPVDNVRRVLRTAGVREAIHRVAPKAIPQMILPWLNRAALHRVSLSAPEFGGTGRILTVLRSNTGMSRMMGNISNTLQQYTGALTVAGMLTDKTLLLKAAPNLLNPGPLRDYVRSLSPAMATRMASEMSAVSANIHEIMMNPSVFQSTKKWTAQHSYFLQQIADAHLTPIIWIAAYNDVKQSTPNISEQDAIHHADSMVRITQGDSSPTGLSTFEAGHPAAQIVTQFFGWSNMQAQVIGSAWAKNMAREVGLPQKYGRAFGIVFLMVLAQAWVAEAIAVAAHGGPDDDDHDGSLIKEWLIAVGLLGLVKFGLGMVPLLGKVGTIAINKWNNKPYDDKISVAPVVSVLESAAYAGPDTYAALFKNGKPSKPIHDIADIGSLFGLPTAPLARPVGYWADVAAHKVRPTGPVDALRGTITGTASPKSKQQ